MSMLNECPVCGQYLIRSVKLGLATNVFECPDCPEEQRYYLLTRSVNICPECHKIEIEIKLVSVNEHRPLTDSVCYQCNEEKKTKVAISD